MIEVTLVETDPSWQIVEGSKVLVEVRKSSLDPERAEREATLVLCEILAERLLA